MSSSIFFIFLVPLYLTESSTSVNKRLLSNLFTNYDKTIHPKGDSDDVIDVKIGLVPITLNLNEDNHVLEMHSWFIQSWRDYRLKWNPSQYENISNVHLSLETVWKPDIEVYNNINNEIPRSTDIILRFGGYLIWIPPRTTHTSCSLDYTGWPWDVQICSLEIGSWMKDGWDIDLNTFKNESDISTFNFVSSTWNILRATQEKMTLIVSNTPFHTLRVTFVLSRNSALDKKMAVLPLTLLSLFLLISFWNSSYYSPNIRIYLSCFSFLLSFIVMASLRNILPPHGAQLPFVFIFICFLASMSLLQIFYNIGIQSLVRRKDIPPGFIACYLDENSLLGKILCLTSKNPFHQMNEMSYTVDVEALSNNKESSSPNSMITGWFLLASAFDRLLFVLYALIIMGLMINYFGGL